MALSLDSRAVREAHEYERRFFPAPSFEGLADAVRDPRAPELNPITDPDLQRTYLDALMDLHQLVEEYRFEALLAFALLRDYALKRPKGEADEVVLSGDPGLDALPLPAEVIVTLQQYARDPPNPTELFERPHEQITHGRIMSLWFAAQQLDSAMFRGIAACDRLAILLRCRAGLAVKTTRRGERRQPAFAPSDLRELESAHEASLAWEQLRELASGPLLSFVRQERNGFTHERRRPSKLHGQRAVVYGSQGNGPREVSQPVDAETHLALVAAFYNEVLTKAIDFTRAIVLDTAVRGLDAADRLDD